VFEWVRQANRAEEAAGDADLREMLGVLALENLLEPEDVQAPHEVLELVEQREAARARRDWAEADRIRDELRSRGWEVRDGPDGPELHPLQ
jgi:cysteinyl-tRNA synthetase